MSFEELSPFEALAIRRGHSRGPCETSATLSMVGGFEYWPRWQHSTAPLQGLWRGFEQNLRDITDHAPVPMLLVRSRGQRSLGEKMFFAVAQGSTKVQSDFLHTSQSFYKAKRYKYKDAPALMVHCDLLQLYELGGATERHVHDVSMPNRWDPYLKHREDMSVRAQELIPKAQAYSHKDAEVLLCWRYCGNVPLSCFTVHDSETARKTCSLEEYLSLRDSIPRPPPNLPPRPWRSVPIPPPLAQATSRWPEHERVLAPWRQGRRDRSEERPRPSKVRQAGITDECMEDLAYQEAFFFAVKNLRSF